jgi:hypothetical protein
VRRLAHRRSDQRGIALSSPLALLSAAAVVLAGAAFVATNGPREAEASQVAAAPAATSAAPAPATTASKPVIKKKPVKKKKPVVRRDATFVEVFNNSGISGLAGSTAARAQGAGWQVVGSDNWYGTIDTSTVYYPAGKADAAKLLAKDLGIGRIKPAIAPMRFDRLTVILTADYS